jgi:bacteriocin-like protein
MCDILVNEPAKIELSEKELKQVSGGYYYRHGHAHVTTSSPLQSLDMIIAGTRVKF